MREGFRGFIENNFCKAAAPVLGGALAVTIACSNNQEEVTPNPNQTPDSEFQLPPADSQCGPFMDFYRSLPEFQEKGFLTLRNEDGKNLAYLDFTPLSGPPGKFGIGIYLPNVDKATDFETEVDKTEESLAPIFEMLSSNETPILRVYMAGGPEEDESGHSRLTEYDWALTEKINAVRPQGQDSTCVENYLGQ